MVNGVSVLALLVMNLDMYLADVLSKLPSDIGYKRKTVNSSHNYDYIRAFFDSSISTNSLVIPYHIAVLVFFITACPAMLFLNCKLFLIARKRHKRNEISPNIKKTFSFKNINSCLLAVACLVLLQIIPVFIYIGLQITLDDVQGWDSGKSAALWAKTIVSTHSTFNCLVFYWKNTILRAEGTKVVKSLKICQRVPS